ncbi:MAG: hypothetical protein WA172_03865 [Terriglobales bacterium]
MLSLPIRALALLALGLAVACGKPTGVPAPSPGNTQKLPFDREARPNGISPSQSLIPATARLVEGTSLTIRLQKSLSSASAQAGESFEGTLDDPVLVDGQPLIARGAPVSGRVLDARSASSGRNAGYLRIALVSVNVGGKTVLIETSSIFAKGTSHGERAATGAGVVTNQQDVVFAPDRRLTFRLAHSADLP